MPGQTQPPDDGLRQKLNELEARIHALETQQYSVWNDPTHASGDPAHGYAVVVIGSLKQITGISGFGIASYKTGSWIQL